MKRILLLLLLTLKSFALDVSSMTLEEKVGQLFMVFFWGENLNDATKNLMRDQKIGNVFYLAWANGLDSEEQVGHLSEEVSNFIFQTVKIPPLIAVDQEGGSVCRLQKGFTHFPSNRALFQTKEPILARKMGKAIGEELLQVGINCNLAPVVDVNTSKENPTINIRSFSSNPMEVALFAKEIIKGFEDSKLLYVLKHFPGYGDVSIDPHLALPTVNKNSSDLEKNELYPFFNLKENAPAIMVGHILVPALDSKNIATFSYDILQKLLREKWKYDGVVIADSLTMNACLEKSSNLEEATESLKKASLKAFLAGCDCMILGRLEWTPFVTTKEEDVKLVADVMSSFVEEVKNGTISEERLNESVLRILKMKKNLRPFQYTKNLQTTHFPLAQEIASKAITGLSIREKKEVKKWRFIVPVELKESLQKVCKESSFSPDIEIYNADLRLNEITPLARKVAKNCKEKEKVVFISHNAHLFENQKKLMKELTGHLSKEKLILVGVKNPYDLIEKPFLKYPIYLTYSPDPFSLKALLVKLLDQK